MFTRLHWRIAVSYVILIALVLVVLDSYLLESLRTQGLGDLEGRIITATLAAVTVSTILATALAILLGRSTTSRIQRLTGAAERLAAGELTHPIRAQGRDELAQLAHALDEMAGRLRAHINALEEERGRLAAVLGHMADGVIITDSEGMVRLINPSAARLLRIAAHRAEGRSVMAVVRDHELAAVVTRALSRDGPGEHVRVFELGPPGFRRTVRTMASRIPSGDGSSENVLVMLQDVTDLRRTETLRREFVANVSHELRTPVAALKALVETLEDGALENPEVARDFLGRMHIEVDGLAQLVEELLELSRIESGRVAMRREAIELSPVVAAAAERLRPFAERQGVTLSIETTESLPLVEADAERIQQVIGNLVHNALKFTPPGERVTVRLQRRGEEAAVIVADTGVGIDPEALPRLFERFFKGDRARASGGTGLGLAIAKHVVQAHGGRIWAESDGEDRGSTFTFVLPLAGTQPAQASPLNQTLSSA